MNFVIDIIFYSILSICCSYVLLIALITLGWFSSRTWKRIQIQPSTRVSVIIPARNESAFILKCLNKITRQHYPSELLEIIIVDDCSTDNTAELVNDFIQKNQEIRITLMKLGTVESSLKKQAISEAIKIATGNLIVTTDADCSMSAEWIASIVEYYEATNSVMIAGPVCFTKSNKLFNKLQELEFLSLIASGAATINLGSPTMSNGANMAYEKKSFLEVEGYDGNTKYASGDDIFLMHKMKKSLNRKIGFIKCYDAIVETEAISSFQAFMNQRKRWASKSRGYKDAATITAALIVFMTNFSLLSCFVLSFFSPTFLFLFLICFMLKFIIDFPVLLGICSFLKKEKLLYLYIPVQFIYPFYIVLTGISGLLGSYKWKDRIHS